MAASKTRGRRARPEAPGSSPELERLRAVVAILEGSSLATLEYEDALVAIRLSRAPAAPAVAAPALAPAVAAPVVVPAPVAAPAESSAVHLVRSPFVGTFYRSPSPEAPSYIEVGQDVARGQTLCIVEAMKLMNEIEAEVGGRVVEVLAENGKAVQYGDALFKIAVSP
jgi:acetyl-CoA carboxylase biotin carboxyl carrier protein